MDSPWRGHLQNIIRKKDLRLMLQVSFLKLCNIGQVISQSGRHYFLNFFGGLFNEKHALICFKLKSYSRQPALGGGKCYHLISFW